MVISADFKKQHQYFDCFINIALSFFIAILLVKIGRLTRALG
jgi:hypothetical protein